MTPEQQKALAIARARLRLQSDQNAPTSGNPQPENINNTLPLGAQEIGQYADGKIYKEVNGDMFFVSPSFATTSQTEINQMLRGEKPQQALGNPGGKIGTAARSALQGLTFGAGDEIVARGASLLSGNPYDAELKAERDRLALGRDQNPVTAIGSEIGGGLATAIATGGMAAPESMIGKTAQNMATGAFQGGLYGFNAGEGGFDNRLNTAKFGAGIGAVGGAAALPLAKGASAIGRGAGNVGAFVTGNGSKRFSSNAMISAMRKSGKTDAEILDALTQAEREGQGMFTVADALGDRGQRTLSGVARSGGKPSETVSDFMLQRQSGQHERVAGQLSDAFGGDSTAAQTEAYLKAARGKAADVAYPAAAADAAPVDLSRALSAIDNKITTGTGGIQLGKIVGRDSTTDALQSIRGRITDGNRTLTDYNSVLSLKQEVGDMIGAAKRAGQNSRVRELTQVSKELDSALEASSPAYRQANDQFAQASSVIDQLDAGKAASRPGSRAGNNIDQFNTLTPEQQAAYKTGYIDPVIGRVENAATGVNVARPLTSDKFTAEAASMANDPALLARQLQREGTMFETSARALGGSKTADNLADIKSVNGLSALQALFRGDLAAAGGKVAGGVANLATGKTEAMREELARMLLSSGRKGSEVVSGLADKSAKSKALRDLLMRRLVDASGVGGGVSQ